MTEFEKLVAKVMSNAFIEPLVSVPKKQTKKHRLTKKIEQMSVEQQELLLLLLKEKLSMLTVHGETYVYRRSNAGWVIRSLQEGEPEHTVLLDFSACSCADCKFRGNTCKHMVALKEVLS
jgi:hypothetical protein